MMRVSSKQGAMMLELYYWTASGWKLVGRTDRYDTAAEVVSRLNARGWVCECVAPARDAAFDVDRRSGYAG